MKNMKLNPAKGDRVDLVAPDGSRQRAIVVTPPKAKRGWMSEIGLRTTTDGFYGRGEISALQAQVTPRLAKRFMA